MDFDAYSKTALIEYPRLCKEFSGMVKTAADLIGAEFNEVMVSETLVAHKNNELMKIGTVDRPTVTVSKDNKTIQFKPDGLTIGTMARILAIPNRGKYPTFLVVPLNCYFMYGQENDTWELTTMQNSNSASPLDPNKIESDMRSIF